jgi:predicted XRE-type DNA-binding protein
VEKSSGNVFADLGVANPEEALAKAELARRISQIISKRHLSQKEAAILLGIDQRFRPLCEDAYQVFQRNVCSNF